MTELEAVSKATQVTRKGRFNRDDNGFEQRHGNGNLHYHTKLLVGQERIGFVSISIEANEYAGRRKDSKGFFTLTPEQAKALANALTAVADLAQKDRKNPEFDIEELPRSVLS